MTCEQIGELLGVSDERARIILHRALAKLEAAGVELQPEDHRDEDRGAVHRAA